ncbi:MAG TPA: hypothetical protein VND99_03210 [Candidatus Acidoferrales bacterium]|nr:hypothetical protein [Candidatus Acidoferrales bacterium]
MKYSAGLFTLIALLAVILIPHAAFADTNISVSNNADSANSSVSVNSQSSGQSISCVNGNCTTTGGGSKTTVCHNGQCTTTDNGNVDYQSDDGHTQIHVDNNTGGNDVTPTITPEPTEDISGNGVTPEPTASLEPTLKQMRKDINDQVEKQVQAVKEHLKSQDDAISAFFKSEMDSLQKLLNNLFK